jgi:hypothetical protein
MPRNGMIRVFCEAKPVSKKKDWTRLAGATHGRHGLALAEIADPGPQRMNENE